MKRDLPVDLPRPRDPSAPAFNELKKELTGLVMEEQRRHERDETRAVAADE